MSSTASTNSKKRRGPGTYAEPTTSSTPTDRGATATKRHKKSGSFGEIPSGITPTLFNKLVDMFAIALEIEHMVIRANEAFELPGREVLKNNLEARIAKKRARKDTSNDGHQDAGNLKASANEVHNPPVDSTLNQFRRDIGTRKGKDALANWFRSFPSDLVGIMGGEGGEEDQELDDGDVRDDDKYSSEYLVNTIVELAEAVQTLEREQRRAEFEGKDVQILPFSSINKHHYTQLGITALPSRITSHAFCGKIREEFVSGGDILVTNENAVEELEALLTRIGVKRRKSWNRYSEQTSRGIIDELQDCLLFGEVLRPPLAQPPYSASDNNGIHIVPEFVILRRPLKTEKEQSSLTMPVDNGQQVTYLSGSTDYLAVSLPPIKSAAATLQSQGQHRSYSSYHRWNSRMADIVAKSSAVMVIEAKWPGAKLDAHIPQVVAEALGLYLRTERPFIPFCLTNSQEFIFGVLSANGGGTNRNENVNAEFWVTECIILDAAVQLLLILSALFYWATQEGQMCWELFAQMAGTTASRK